MFWQHRARLLGSDRDDLEECIINLRTDSTSLDNRIQALGINDDTVQPKEILTGVPSPQSRIAVDLGRPVIPTGTWTPSSFSKKSIIIWIVEVQKAQTYPKMVYSQDNNEEKTTTTAPRHVVLALPSPKSDSWAYKSALVKLLNSLDLLLTDDVSIIIRPGSHRHHDWIINPHLALNHERFDESISSLIDDQQDIVSSRKLLIPVVLLLLCHFPEVSCASGELARLDKGRISAVLLSLVAFWPDGNPPRAALKRVNELLLGSGKP